MNPVTTALTFVMIWWLIFFIALPIGIKRDDNIMPGNSPAAPSNPNLFLKSLITTILSTVLTVAFFYLQNKGVLDFLSPRG